MRDETHAIPSSSPAPDLPRVLSVWHAAAIVVGTIIGSGIFLVPQEMMRAVGSAGMVYLAWIVGGVLTLFGAMTYAELGAMMPQRRRRIRFSPQRLRRYSSVSLYVDLVCGRQARIDRHCHHRPGPYSWRFPCIRRWVDGVVLQSPVLAHLVTDLRYRRRLDDYRPQLPGASRKQVTFSSSSPGSR